MTGPSLRKLTWIFLRVGNTTFGGGIPTIAALQRELVEQEDWLSPEDYALAFSLARITPGTNVIAFCAAAGARIRGWSGALAGTFAETAPSAMLAILMTQGFESWRGNAWVLAGVAGTVAAVVGMMWSSGASMLKPYLKTAGDAVRAVVIVGAAFLALSKFRFNPLYVLAAAVVVGLLWSEPNQEERKP